MFPVKTRKKTLWKQRKRFTTAQRAKRVFLNGLNPGKIVVIFKISFETCQNCKFGNSHGRQRQKRPFSQLDTTLSETLLFFLYALVENEKSKWHSESFAFSVEFPFEPPSLTPSPPTGSERKQIEIVVDETTASINPCVCERWYLSGKTLKIHRKGSKTYGGRIQAENKRQKVRGGRKKTARISRMQNIHFRGSEMSHWQNRNPLLHPFWRESEKMLLLSHNYKFSQLQIASIATNYLSHENKNTVVINSPMPKANTANIYPLLRHWH